MPSPESRSAPKSEEELKIQLDFAEDRLKEKIIPPSSSEKELFSMSVSEIEEKYPRRYKIYLKLMRELNYFGNSDESQQTENVILSNKQLEEMQKWLRVLNSLDQYVQNHISGEIEPTLKQRQLTVFEDIRNFLERGGTEGYVKLPTGFGKTVLFAEFVEAIDLKTMVVVPTKIILGQTEEKMDKFAPDLDVGKVYTNAKEYGHHVTIITYDSLQSQLKNEVIKPEEYDCLILDEAHVSLSPARMEAVNKFKNAIKIGFTATAKFSEKKKVKNLLETEIHRIDVREAVEEGLLSAVSCIVAKTEIDLSKVQITGRGEYDEKSLEKAVNIESRNRAAIQLYKQAFSGERAIVYCVGVEHAEKMAQMFNEGDVVASLISGKTSGEEQKEIKEKFANGEIKVLCNADILVEGFDEPKATICLNLQPTRSRVRAEQRAGRVLRLNPDDPNKHAYVVDFLDQKGKKPPILFADIIDGAVISENNKRKKEGQKNPGGEVPKFPTVDIEGIEVVVDAEEIMKIVTIHKQMEDEKRTFLPFTELRNQVRVLGIKSWTEYYHVYKDYPGWPSLPNKTYESEWPGWDEFFARENLSGSGRFLSYEELQKDVQKSGVKSRLQYLAVYRQHPGWPSNPQHYYIEPWSGWNKLFQKESKKFITLEKLKLEVRALGIKGITTYARACISYPTWPTNPSQTYKDSGWVSYADFFGKEAGKVSLDQLKIEVLSFSIDSIKEYREKAKESSSWPAAPDVFYKVNGWKGWPDLFGREKRK